MGGTGFLGTHKAAVRAPCLASLPGLGLGRSLLQPLARGGPLAWFAHGAVACGRDVGSRRLALLRRRGWALSLRPAGLCALCSGGESGREPKTPPPPREGGEQSHSAPCTPTRLSVVFQEVPLCGGWGGDALGSVVAESCFPALPPGITSSRLHFSRSVLSQGSGNTSSLSLGPTSHL